MKLKISNRAEAFFDLFTESAENLRTAAELLQDLIGDYRDVELKAQRIADREHEGDEVTHAIIRLLNTTFVTPMDREDIYQLATALDDVMDAIEAVVRPLRPASDRGASAGDEGADRRAGPGRPSRPSRRWRRCPTCDANGSSRTGSRSTGSRTRATGSTGEPSPTCSPASTGRWTSSSGRTSSRTLEEALDGLENVANIIESIVLKHA